MHTSANALSLPMVVVPQAISGSVLRGLVLVQMLNGGFSKQKKSRNGVEESDSADRRLKQRPHHLGRNAACLMLCHLGALLPFPCIPHYRFAISQ